MVSHAHYLRRYIPTYRWRSIIETMPGDNNITIILYCPAHLTNRWRKRWAGVCRVASSSRRALRIHIPIGIHVYCTRVYIVKRSRVRPCRKTERFFSGNTRGEKNQIGFSRYGQIVRTCQRHGEKPTANESHGESTQAERRSVGRTRRIGHGRPPMSYLVYLHTRYYTLLFSSHFIVCICVRVCMCVHSRWTDETTKSATCLHTCIFIPLCPLKRCRPRPVDIHRLPCLHGRKRGRASDFIFNNILYITIYTHTNAQYIYSVFARVGVININHFMCIRIERLITRD